MALNIQADIVFSQQPDGNYTCDATTTIVCGAGEEVIVTRLDYAAGVVGRDSDLDGNFDDEAWLTDADRNGISTPLVTKYASENAAAANPAQAVALRGVVQSVNELTGKLWLVDVVEISDSGRTEIGTLELNFTEGTRFDELLVDKYGELTYNKAPSMIGLGKQISLATEFLPANDNSSKSIYWLERTNELSLDFPDDTIVAVPSKQTAVTGEAVSITVYANQTAQPFFALENVRIVFEDSNEILHGSLNAGSRGGAAVRADGIWADMNAEHVISSSKMPLSVVSTGDGQSYADFSLQPTGGNELLNATGALFNFQLICYDDATPGVQSNTGLDWITSFTDVNQQSHVWLNADDIQAMLIAVKGRPLRLSLVNPPAQGTGQEDTPYITDAGVSYQLRLIDPVLGEVTQHPDANYLYSTNGDIRQLSITNGVLSIAAGFAGDVWICGVFRNVYTKEDDQLHLLVDPAD